MSRPRRLALLVIAALGLLVAPAGAEPKRPPAVEVLAEPVPASIPEPAEPVPASIPEPAEPAGPEPLLAPPPAAARVLGAAGIVVLLGGLAAVGIRRVASAGRPRRSRAPRPGLIAWLGRWSAPPDRPRERIELVSRRALGPREALCLVQVGALRLLVGVTATQISLLARLDAVAAAPEPLVAGPGGPAPEARAAEFADELERVRREDEAALQELIARSRERLARLVTTPPAGGSL
jgi:flagellar biogenesis protein FliO